MTKYDYQVIIVGAGPAGAICAHELSTLGISVLIIEKEKLPREKPCGGALPNKIGEVINIDISNVIVNSIKTVTFKYKSKHVLYQGQKPFINLVKRSEFDYFLTNEACKTGAEIHDREKVQDIEEVKDGVVIITSSGRYSCRVVVGADGVLSTTASIFDLNRKKNSSITYEGNFDISRSELQKEGRDNILLDFDIIPYGYGWVFPKNNVFSVGIGQVIRKKSNYKKLFHKFIKENNINYYDYTYKPRGYLIPKGGKIPRLYDKNVLLVGDAAGLVDPLTGEGIYYAIRSGIIAAGVINEHFKEQCGLKRYQEIIEDEIGIQFKYAKRLTYLFYNFTSLIFNLMENDKMFLESIIKTVSGEINYQDLYSSVNKFSIISRGLKYYFKN